MTIATTVKADLSVLSSGTEIPEDGSQDLIAFCEPLDDDHQIAYTPELLYAAVEKVDGKKPRV